MSFISKLKVIQNQSTHNTSPIQSIIQGKFSFSYSSEIEITIKIRHFSSYYLKNVSMCLQIQEPPNKGIINNWLVSHTGMLFTNLSLFSSLKHCSNTQL